MLRAQSLWNNKNSLEPRIKAGFLYSKCESYTTTDFQTAKNRSAWRLALLHLHKRERNISFGG